MPVRVHVRVLVGAAEHDDGEDGGEHRDGRDDQRDEDQVPEAHGD